jgi:hypothetical protein
MTDVLALIPFFSQGTTTLDVDARKRGRAIADFVQSIGVPFLETETQIFQEPEVVNPANFWYEKWLVKKQVTHEFEGVNKLCQANLKKDGALRRTKRSRIRTRVENTLEPDACTNELPGDRRLKNIYTDLDNTGYERSYLQTLFHDEVILCLLPHIFGEDWDACKTRLLKQFQKRHHNLYLCTIMGRRMGKTIALSMLVAATLLGVPNFRFCLISPTVEQSCWLLQDVKLFLLKLLGNDTSRIVKNTTRVLWIADEHGNRNILSKIEIFVASKNSRGMGGSCILFDEASQIPISFVRSVTAPVLTVRHTSWITISTPLTCRNWLSVLINAKDDAGDAVIPSFLPKLVCNICKEAGMLDETGEACVHNTHLQPHWKADSSSMQKLKFLYENDPALMAQELAGKIITPDDSCFSDEQIANLERAPIWERPTSTPARVFIAIDPTAGGASHMAIVSMYLDRDTIVVSYKFLMCYS